MKWRDQDIAFEDALSDDWRRDIEVAEVSIGNRPMRYLAIVVAVLVLAVAVRIIVLDFSNTYYAARAERNVAQENETPAPRGIIYDSEGDVLADNKATFSALLDVQTFLENENQQSSTLAAIGNILGISQGDVWSLVAAAQKNDFASPVVLADNLDQSEIVNLQALGSNEVELENDFARTYPNGPIFSSVVGYAGRVTADDIKKDPSLKNQDVIGKAGIEAFYDQALRGVPGVALTYTNAQGKTLGQKQQSVPQIGTPLTLTIDGGLQTYFYNVLSNQLANLGRPIGLGVAMDPRTGAVLSLINLPGYDNNVFSETGQDAVIQDLLTSSDRPLFNRAVNGYYNPGSTIKPLDAVAALSEGVIDSTREIYSPGYLLVPNPYNPSAPSRYLDWQYQGSVNMAAALAQSSDVYFYIVGGGSPPESTPMLNDPSDYGISGLGIGRLHEWWQKFGLGKPTGIDMPNEGSGFLPTPAWKQEHSGIPWLLGDTYNVSIGQGDLLLTPIQLLDYISAIANGGDIYRPFLNASSTPVVSEDLTSLLPEIKQVQQGMIEGVSSPKGTSYTLHNLPVSICAKTGSAQVENNTQENALFVGYAPCDNPQIALLILIENSRQGSLNAVPVAGQVLNWYYENRIVARN
jgi:penicillin-binding protein 2